MRAVLTSDRLETFLSHAEFTRYVRRTRDKKREIWPWDVFNSPNGGATLLAQVKPEPCNPAVEECKDDSDDLAEVQVTGARVSAGGSITNNQTAGVDEGDIVKSWGRFLVILHDARLFSVDLGEAAGKLRLADRVDAYQDSDTNAWYDELLIQDNHVMVTGYSYDAEQTEISVFDISQNGRLSLQSRFFIKSEDYYSGGNYASRLVNGRLVLYVPIDLDDLDTDAIEFPKWRRWSPREGFTAWRPLLLPTDIYKPVDPVLGPVVHVMASCPVLPGKSGQCESRGVIASRNRELYVTPDAAYLWNMPDSAADYAWNAQQDCRDEAAAAGSKPRPATVFRYSFGDGVVTAVRAHGRPPDQFALESHSNRFHALVRRMPADCREYRNLPLELVTFSLREFSDLPSPLLPSNVKAMPVAGEGRIATRFSADYLTYGAGAGWWRARDEKDAVPSQYTFVTVPLSRPAHLQQHELTHSVERVELLGENVIAFGVSADRSLGATTLDLRGSPRIAGSVRIAGAIGSERRSHAFNARVQEDGSAVLGLPTEVGTGKNSKYGYEESEDRLQFFTADSRLNLSTAGALAGDQLPGNPGYKCEVSCLDWYGNTRPIFYRDRIFALMGREFVEGELRADRISEISRLDLTGHPDR